ncbi:MAG: oligopeptide transporter, OPT family [Candidatus Eremiobacteraeota bacterium]|nr:oligopeptide transporter, OPT family [Candidatus Eremiobacteraeota bacterium]
MENKEFKPYVSADTSMKEFTLPALVIGLIMSVVLGAANAYLGLKAGMTIAATYPAAVIGMALLRLFRGSILEENITRTVGSIGESVAAGAIFTLPAFIIAKIWTGLNYWECTEIMLVGGIIGILFVTILRRVMVEDRDLPFPESVAAAEIHKAGQGGSGANLLFMAMGVGALVKALGEFKFFAATWEKFVYFSKSSIMLTLKKNELDIKEAVTGSGGALITTPGVSPAYMGVGYIIGPTLACLNFSGGLLAWGLFVPLLMYFMGPQIFEFLAKVHGNDLATYQNESMITLSYQVWKFMVRPIAIGGMLVSAAYTLYNMRKNLIEGLRRAITDVKKAAGESHDVTRTEKDLDFKFVFGGLILATVFTFFVYNQFTHNVMSALVAAVVMIIAGFFFAAVSGYLVGLIGSSNNPISGLTISTLVVAALLMVILGQKGQEGVAAVLGVAAVVCVSAAVAGEMLQDLKVGHILGGTPWKMQIGDLLGVVLSASVMVFPLMILHQGDINKYGPEIGGFGGKTLPAPQAGLMAMLAQGIVGGEMAWPLIIIGMIMAVGFILIKVKSPMLVSVGMYLPFETTAAIFIGGMVKGLVEFLAEQRKYGKAQKEKVENAGVLVASGLIAGEALIGLVFATMAFMKIKTIAIFQNPTFYISILVIVAIGALLTFIPLKEGMAEPTPADRPGKPDEPPSGEKSTGDDET